jgi:hypothetical protein
MTKDEQVQHMKDAGFSYEQMLAALAPGKDAPEKPPGEALAGNEAMNAAIRSTLGRDAEPATNMNDAIRAATGHEVER